MLDRDPPRMGESERLLEVIRTQTDIVKQGLDLAGVMAVVTERAQLLTGAQGGVVELVEGDEMVYSAATGIAETHLGLRLKVADSISGLCVRQGNPLRCDDAETDDRVNQEACRRIGLRSMIVVPLRHNGATVGVLKVLGQRPAAFEELDLRLLGLMADFIAASMFHATHNESGGLFHLATHDAMTGLANRALFYDRLRHCLAQAERERRQFAVLNFDMDGLKPINDKLGHRAGDAAITEFATRLKQASRAADTVARLGGDEFGAVLSRVDQPDGAVTHISRLVDRFAQPFQFEGRAIPLKASIGCAIYPDHGTDVNTLVEHADQAMYVAKRAGKTEPSPA